MDADTLLRAICTLVSIALWCGLVAENTSIPAAENKGKEVE